MYVLVLVPKRVRLASIEQAVLNSYKKMPLFRLNNGRIYVEMGKYCKLKGCMAISECYMLE